MTTQPPGWPCCACRAESASASCLPKSSASLGRAATARLTSSSHSCSSSSRRPLREPPLEVWCAGGGRGRPCCYRDNQQPWWHSNGTTGPWQGADTSCWEPPPFTGEFANSVSSPFAGEWWMDPQLANLTSSARARPTQTPPLGLMQPRGEPMGPYCALQISWKCIVWV